MKSTPRPNHRHRDQPQPPRPRRKVVVDLSLLLAPGDEPLSDERLCTCGHLEADHRISGECSCCQRCRAFELDPDPDLSVLPRGAERW